MADMIFLPNGTYIGVTVENQAWCPIEFDLLDNQLRVTYCDRDEDYEDGYEVSAEQALVKKYGTDQDAEIARLRAVRETIAEMVQPGLADLHGDWNAVEGLLENIAMVLKEGGE